MPFAKFKCVREVSSEDNNYPAANLLKSTARKWRNQVIGERVAYVILELSEPYKITGIDIGNEFSAFIEVLAGKTSNTNNFIEILVTCSFMTPIESKNSTDTNRVRCFNKEALVPTAASEKWQFIKIICTQPFNKHVQYGISFIKIHVAESEHGNATKSVTNDINIRDLPPSPNSSLLGKFKLREDSPDSDSESSTALFKRWKASEFSDKNSAKNKATTSKNVDFSSGSETGNARLSDSCASTTISKSALPEKQTYENGKKTFEILDRNRDNLAFGNDETSENQKVNKKRHKLLETIELERQQLRLKTEKTKEQKKAVGSSGQGQSKISTENEIKKNRSNEHPKPTPNMARDESKPPSKENSVENGSNSTKIVLVEEKTLVYRPFNQLLKGTILVISGIQNPERSQLRDKALAMGAKYRPDWGDGCTHLICAFKNTPKYNQVKGNGKIVTRAWVEDCHRQKKKLPWRRYGLDSSDLNQPDSEEEILVQSVRPVELAATNENLKNLDFNILNSNSNAVKSFIVTSESDTEDEIQKVLQTNNASSDQRNSNASKRSVFDLTTEEEEFLTKKTKLNSTVKQPGIFKGAKFFICNDIQLAERKRVERLLEKNEGSCICDKSEAKYLLSNDPDTTRNNSTNGILVKPDWIYECFDMEMEVPIKKYIL